MALVHSSGKLYVPSSIEEAYVEDAWRDVMETFVESLIDSRLAADGCVV